MESVIKKVVLQLGRKEVELTLEEAKKLKESLDEMFGKDVIRYVHDGWYWGWPCYTSGNRLHTGDAIPLKTDIICNNTLEATYDSLESSLTMRIA